MGKVTLDNTLDNGSTEDGGPTFDGVTHVGGIQPAGGLGENVDRLGEKTDKHFCYKTRRDLPDNAVNLCIRLDLANSQAIRFRRRDKSDTLDLANRYRS